MAPNAQKFYPVFDKNTPPELQGHFLDAFTALNDHDAAIGALKDQLDAAVIAANDTINNITQNITENTINGLLGLGVLNNQTAQTTYALQNADAGSLIWFDDPSAIALSLNSTITTPFFTFIFNNGAGTITATPTTGTLHGLATIAQNVMAILAFDGTDWWSTATTPGGGGSPNFADNETPTPPVDGATTVFVLAHTPSPGGSLILSLAGQIQDQGGGLDFTLAGPNITFTSAPVIGPLLAWYRY